MNAYEFIKEHKFIAIFRHIPKEYAERAARAVYDGGVRIFEVTFNPSSPTTVEDTKQIIRAIKALYGDSVCVVGRNALKGAERKRLFLKADQILCGRNKTRTALNEEMRAYRGIGKEQVLPLDGEKLICTLNDWEKALDREEKFYLVNGIIGEAREIKESFDDLATMEFQADFMDESVKVPFDLGIFKEGKYRHLYGDRAITLSDGTVAHEGNFQLLHKLRAVGDEPICRFEFAYAITCHKAQGSEFDFVIVFDESWAFGEEGGRWLYTAITRAKEKLLIIR